MALTCVAVVPARQMQDWYDDTRQWNEARAIGEARSFRGYLQRRPGGRYAELARQRLRNVYTEASEKFQRSVNVSESDRGALDAALGMLRHASRTGAYKVGVYFERRNDIPPNVEAFLRERFGVSNVAPIGDSFSEPNMRAREEAIVEHIRNAFGKVISSDVLAFEMNPSSLPPLWFVVKYQVRAGKAIYYNTKEKDTPDADRSYYPGVFFDWTIQICPGDLEKRYMFTLSSNPADHIQVDTSGNSSASAIYLAMSRSAFTSLEQEVEKRFGLQESPTP